MGPTVLDSGATAPLVFSDGYWYHNVPSPLELGTAGTTPHVLISDSVDTAMHDCRIHFLHHVALIRPEHHAVDAARPHAEFIRYKSEATIEILHPLPLYHVVAPKFGLGLGATLSSLSDPEELFLPRIFPID